jgi:hypothetical protein
MELGGEGKEKGVIVSNIKVPFSVQVEDIVICTESCQLHQETSLNIDFGT